MRSREYGLMDIAMGLIDESAAAALTHCKRVRLGRKSLLIVTAAGGTAFASALYVTHYRKFKSP